MLVGTLPITCLNLFVCFSLSMSLYAEISPCLNLHPSIPLFLLSLSFLYDCFPCHCQSSFFSGHSSASYTFVSCHLIFLNSLSLSDIRACLTSAWLGKGSASAVLRCIPLSIIFVFISILQTLDPQNTFLQSSSQTSLNTENASAKCNWLKKPM